MPYDLSQATQQAMPFTVDGITLSGVLHLPQCQPSAAIIGCHGLLSDGNSPKQIDLAKRCAACGMAYFRFDHRGCGRSQGDFGKDTTLENRSRDLLAAVDAVKVSLGRTIPIGLFGSSLGGTVCLSTANRIVPFAVVTLAAPCCRRSIRFPDNAPPALTSEILSGGLAFDITGVISTIDHILVIHGSRDETVPLKNANLIFDHATPPKRLIVLEGGDHRITDTDHQRYYMREAADWFVRCRQGRFSIDEAVCKKVFPP